mmetsp:Transcript_32685/g.96166  ORF Transcript_32685/g.96166 Transcript_32685/m.96166 type:complete len:223 (-) Transcript_32685:676-1344(-)
MDPAKAACLAAAALLSSHTGIAASAELHPQLPPCHRVTHLQSPVQRLTPACCNRQISQSESGAGRTGSWHHAGASLHGMPAPFSGAAAACIAGASCVLSTDGSRPSAGAPGARFAAGARAHLTLPGRCASQTRLSGARRRYAAAGNRCSLGGLRLCAAKRASRRGRVHLHDRFRRRATAARSNSSLRGAPGRADGIERHVQARWCEVLFAAPAEQVPRARVT